MAFEVQMAAGATLSGLAPHSLTGFERGQPWDGSDLLTKHASHIDLQTIPITALIPPRSASSPHSTGAHRSSASELQAL